MTTTPAAGMTLLSSRQITQRAPENLMQALETVPGVNQVSEGHASVPAIRGLARGRTLLLIDGGRVTSERRVGPSATFADPAAFEGIDVARGPGSVAYGSDALGGVISVRTRRAEPGSPLQVRGSGTLGGGIPDRRGVLEVSKGLARGGVIFQAHGRSADDWDGPEDGEILNSGWKDRGFLARVDHQVGKGTLSVGLQSDFGKDIERPRNNSNVVRFYYPYEDSHRFTSSYELLDVAGFRQMGVTAFVGTFEQRTDQDRFATATTGRSIERADISANDFHVKGNATRAVGPARIEFGVDVNGRYDLNALDVRLAYDLAGAVTSDVTNVSIDNAHRTDTGAYVQADVPVAKQVRLSGGLRGDYVTTREHRRFLRRSIDRQRRVLRLRRGHGRTVLWLERHRAGLPWIPRSHALRPLLPWPVGSWLHHGQSGSRARNEPSVRPRHAVCEGTDPAGRLFLQLHDRRSHRALSDADGFLLLPQSRQRPRPRVRGRGPHGAARRTSRLEVGANIGRGEALDDDANLDDISPDTFSLLVRKDFAARAFAQMRAAFLAEDDRPGPSEVDGARGDADRSRRRIQVREIPRAPRQRPQPARRRLLRQPGSALGMGAGPFGQRHARVSVLKRNR